MSEPVIAFTTMVVGLWGVCGLVMDINHDLSEGKFFRSWLIMTVLGGPILCLSFPIKRMFDAFNQDTPQMNKTMNRIREWTRR